MKHQKVIDDQRRLAFDLWGYNVKAQNNSIKIYFLNAWLFYLP